MLGFRSRLRRTHLDQYEKPRRVNSRRGTACPHEAARLVLLFRLFPRYLSSIFQGARCRAAWLRLFGLARGLFLLSGILDSREEPS